MKTFATNFTGGDLAGVGAMAAGLVPLWGNEIDPDIAAVAEMNIKQQMVVGAIQALDFSLLAVPFWWHVSPVCVNASVAKQDAQEAAEDISAAQAVARGIAVLQPPMFSLENVWKYREFESFRIICAALEMYGYNFRFWHLNAADYGVPQTRKRLILVASRVRKVEKPQATHRQHGDKFCSAWVGWYQAIEDLIPTLPESKFAEWQLKRLALTDTHLVTNQNDAPNTSLDRKPVSVAVGNPAPCVMASDHNKFRVFIVDSQNTQKAQLTRPHEAPAFTVTNVGRPSHMPLAFIIPGDNASNSTVRTADEPMVAIQTRSVGQCPHKAFIIDGKNTRTTTDEPFTLRDESQPCFAVTALDGSERHRAFIDGLPESQPDLFKRKPDWLSQGRVVSMTPRALARFQSIPDSYALPIKNSLACRVIGNAVPPKLMQRIIEANV